MKSESELTIDCYMMQILLDYGIERIIVTKIVLKAEPGMCYALSNALFFGLLVFKKE